MSRRLAWILLIVLVPGAFLAGSRFLGISRRSREPGERSVLYWVDPMNPGIHSSTPGIAPCGMPFEPVYADGRPAAAASGSRAPSPPPGSVSVLPEVQQLAGVRVEAAQIRSVTTTLRLFGRVVADESRVYRLYSVTDGWIRQISTAATGTYVKKDELLAAYYSPEIPGPQQAYISALEALDRLSQSGSTNADQPELTRRTARTAKQQLLNLGMGETQIEEIARTRTVARTVELRAPVSGFLLVRNASMGQRFDRTTELYVIADLERVWVVADASGDDVEQLVPGTRAAVRVAGSREAVPAVVSGILPRFDPAAKALKVRLEASNARFVLRPDMFVDVEAAVTRHRALVVPTAAVLDSGLQKTVFVDRGGGAFERRPVETGWRAGGFVEIAAGLAAGERVAVSGNFLLDSESRMRLVGPAAPASAADLPRPPP